MLAGAPQCRKRPWAVAAVTAHDLFCVAVCEQPAAQRGQQCSSREPAEGGWRGEGLPLIWLCVLETDGDDAFP